MPKAWGNLINVLVLVFFCLTLRKYHAWRFTLSDSERWGLSRLCSAESFVLHYPSLGGRKVKEQNGEREPNTLTTYLLMVTSIH